MPCTEFFVHNARLARASGFWLGYSRDCFVQLSSVGGFKSFPLFAILATPCANVPLTETTISEGAIPATSARSIMYPFSFNSGIFCNKGYFHVT